MCISSLNLLSLHLYILSLKALGYLGASLSSRVRVYPLKIGDWGFERKQEGDLQHIDSLTCIHSCHEMSLRQEIAHFVSLSLKTSPVLIFSLS